MLASHQRDFGGVAEERVAPGVDLPARLAANGGDPDGDGTVQGVRQIEEGAGRGVSPRLDVLDIDHRGSCWGQRTSGRRRRERSVDTGLKDNVQEAGQTGPVKIKPQGAPGAADLAIDWRHTAIALGRVG